MENSLDFLEDIQKYLEASEVDSVKNIIEGMHPADIADIMEQLSLDEAISIYLVMDAELAADAIAHLEDDSQKRLLRNLPSDIIASKVIEHMDSDDATDAISWLSEEKRGEVIGAIDDFEHASDIVNLLKYDEDSAGGLMATELVKVNLNWTVQTCLKEISDQAQEVDEIYYVYVVDDNDILKGVLSLKNLILNSTTKTISDIYEGDIQYVRSSAPSEEVAQVMEKYDLVAIPVVDELGVLQGRITVDDILEVVREEAEKDFQMATGISEDVESSDSILRQVRARIPWLFVGLIGGVFGARVISFFEHHDMNAKLAMFIPLIAAMGGNVGVQSSSIVVQGLAANKIDNNSLLIRLLKELGVALVNAVVLSSLIFGYNLLFSDSFALTLSVSISLFSVIIFASVFGTLVPLLLNKIDIDPALATGPFITTVNDIIGLIIYLIIGTNLFEIFPG